MVKSKLHVLMGIKKIRNISQLAKETGLSRPTLYRLYNDNGEKIEFETIIKLCEFFECDIGDLLYVERKSLE